MKYLIVLLVIVLVLWLLRSARPAVKAREQAPPPAPPQPPALEQIVECPRCGMHLPKGEALPGLGGHYCSEVHRSEHERELQQR